MNGAVYEGQYVEGKKCGKGKLTYPDKSVYDGEWAEDVQEGQGTFVYASGDVYTGAHHAGKRHGQGMYHYKTSHCQLIGEWQEGGFVTGRWVHRDGSMFHGTFAGGVQPVRLRVRLHACKLAGWSACNCACKLAA